MIKLSHLRICIQFDQSWDEESTTRWTIQLGFFSPSARYRQSLLMQHTPTPGNSQSLCGAQTETLLQTLKPFNNFAQQIVWIKQLVRKKINPSVFDGCKFSSKSKFQKNKSKNMPEATRPCPRAFGPWFICRLTDQAGSWSKVEFSQCVDLWPSSWSCRGVWKTLCCF